MSDTENFSGVVRDEGERIRVFVTMLSQYLLSQDEDKFSPPMVMLAEIDAHLERLVDCACDEGARSDDYDSEANPHILQVPDDRRALITEVMSMSQSALERFRKALRGATEKLAEGAEEKAPRELGSDLNC